MKKILSLFIGVLLVASLCLTAFATEGVAATISGTSQTVKAGATVTVDFKIENNPGFDSTKMKVTVDAPLSLTNLTAGLMNSALNLKSESEAIISHASTEVTSNGTLFSVTVKVAADAEPGKYPVNLKVERLNVKGEEEHVAVAHSVVKTYIIVEGEPAPEHKHDFKPVEHKEPTCTEAGYVLHKCECGETLKEELKALGHDWNAKYEKDDTHHWHLCKRVNAGVTCGTHSEHEKHEHNIKKAGEPNKLFCICDHWIDITNDDDEPETGDITASITFGTAAMISVAAAAAYVASRKFAK